MKGKHEARRRWPEVGGYPAGPRTVDELAPPPRGPGAGMPRCRTCDGDGEWTDPAEGDRVLCPACGGTGSPRMVTPFDRGYCTCGWQGRATDVEAHGAVHRGALNQEGEG